MLFGKVGKLIKPIVKECILESLIEEGILSSIISEVVAGTQPVLENRQYLQENTPPQPQVDRQREALQQRQQHLEESRQKMMESINSDAYGGVNLFEGTVPTSAPSSGPGSPLGDVDPGDPGIDISGIMGLGATKWKALSE